MSWAWELPDWPDFRWDAEPLAPLEARFLHGAGRLVGAWQHLEPDGQERLRIDWLSAEAMDTSAIEGEDLDRESVQSSVRRQFGLSVDRRPSGPREAGIAEMMVALYRHFDAPLTVEMLKDWHRMLMNGRRDLEVIGGWRRHDEAMQIVSGPDYAPKVHFEAPPSARMGAEMARFVAEFEKCRGLPTLTRAGLAHLHFVSVHPFEDGNGRIGRALAEKAIAQSLGQPSLIALSQAIAREKRGYYDALEAVNRGLDVTSWLVWSARIALRAQELSAQKLKRVIDQSRMFARLDGKLNARQEKALKRLFRAEPEGFVGGLSAANYAQITGAHGATVTRDLADLVAKGALRREGSRRYTRYYLDVPELTPR